MKASFFLLYALLGLTPLAVLTITVTMTAPQETVTVTTTMLVGPPNVLEAIQGAAEEMARAEIEAAKQAADDSVQLATVLCYTACEQIIGSACIEAINKMKKPG